jgi:transposase-like protein
MERRTVAATMMDVTVEIHCGTCGSANYSLPDNAAGGQRVKCNDCGRDLGGLDDLQTEMLAQAVARSAEALRRDLGEMPRGDGA